MNVYSNGRSWRLELGHMSLVRQGDCRRVALYLCTQCIFVSVFALIQERPRPPAPTPPTPLLTSGYSHKKCLCENWHGIAHYNITLIALTHAQILTFFVDFFYK